jgi:hypothetical protein
MEIIEFQNSIWTRNFVDLRKSLDGMEVDRLEIGFIHNYEDQIVKLWTNLPETFSNLKKNIPSFIDNIFFDLFM